MAKIAFTANSDQSWTWTFVPDRIRHAFLMPIEPGSRLGPYDVVAPIGAGGMGEVYRARDSRLKRDVALKILPAFFAADSDRLARFEREAQALAALNHPNIAAIYGFEEGSGEGDSRVRALVLELVEGETLAERIARGPVPVHEALTIARQIAAALEVAHEQGIVHRDLKPANIKITPGGVVKVLDFGLAKLTQGSDSRVQTPGSGASLAQTFAASMSPTMTSPALVTGAGVLLGTAAYMAPEQARGKAVDKRADIWAFGVVLYEMLTGTRAFGGDSVTETAGAVIHKELDWSATPKDLPASAQTVLRRCLQKDPSQRVRDMGDVRLALDGAFTPDTPVTTAAPRVGTGRRIVEVAAAALVAAVMTGAAVWMLTRTDPPARFPVRINVPASPRMGPFLALSPDGRSFAFVAVDAGNVPRLWVHSLETAESRALTNAGVVRTPPFWSPDGKWLAFAADGKLKRIDVGAGLVETLCDVGNLLGGTWTSTNVILFADLTKRGIMQVPAGGGTAVQRTLIDEKRGEGGHFLPWALPDGRHFLYLLGGNNPQINGIYVGSIDTAPAEQDRTRLSLAPRQGVAYAPASDAGTGYLLFLRDGLLMAQVFDPERRELSGEATPVAEQVGNDSIFGSFAVSANGTLAYLRASSETGSLVLVGRGGQSEATIAASLKGVSNPRLSPDGRSLAVVISGDVWRYDLDGRPPIKLTFAEKQYSPLWTRDGQRVVSEVSGKNQLAAVPADGSGGTPQQVSPSGHFHPHGWTADGTEIIAVRMPDQSKDSSSADLVKFAARADGQVQTIVATPAGEGSAAWVSPDGRWLAYTSDSTGRTEIWVRPIPGPGAAVRVSPNGGTEPLWARNGKELFYLESSNMMAVAVEAGAAFNFKPPTRLFESTYQRGEQPPSFDVAPDGRFVMIKPDSSGDAPITVILNWTELLRQRGATH
jgi:Tol biopolymer transport system component